MGFNNVPSWLIVVIAVWVALIETAEKVPMILLSYPRYEASKAEVEVKILQPDLLKAQITKAMNEAATSLIQIDLTKAQLEKARNDALASVYQPQLGEVQVRRAQIDAVAATQGIAERLMVFSMPTMADNLTSSHPWSTALNILYNPTIPKAIPQFPNQFSPPAEQSKPQASPPKSATEPQRSKAYTDGARDRQSWTAWLATLDEQTKDGATANERVINAGGSTECYVPGYMRSEVAKSQRYLAGCTAAQARINQIREKAAANKDYRKGWEGS